jgi:hypothetical protein
MRLGRSDGEIGDFGEDKIREYSVAWILLDADGPEPATDITAFTGAGSLRTEHWARRQQKQRSR